MEGGIAVNPLPGRRKLGDALGVQKGVRNLLDLVCDGDTAKPAKRLFHPLDVGHRHGQGAPPVEQHSPQDRHIRIVAVLTPGFLILAREATDPQTPRPAPMVASRQIREDLWIPRLPDRPVPRTRDQIQRRARCGRGVLPVLRRSESHGYCNGVTCRTAGVSSNVALCGATGRRSSSCRRVAGTRRWCGRWREWRMPFHRDKSPDTAARLPLARHPQARRLRLGECGHARRSVRGDLDASSNATAWIMRTPEVSGRNSDVVLDRETQHGHGAGHAGACSGRGQHDDGESRRAAVRVRRPPLSRNTIRSSR